MQIIKRESYKSLSIKITNDLIKNLQFIKRPVFCVASGDSPKGLYKELVKSYRKGFLDPSNWYFLGVDEWLGLNKNNRGSCRNTLNLDLFDPLNIKGEQIYFFDGKANDPINECKRIENFINSHGPIDLAVLGLGLNGHIGFNEPGTSFTSRSHVSKLDSLTKEVGQKYFPRKKRISKGITLGLANIMEARQVFLIASGRKKASIVQKVLKEDISEEIPATLLRNHPAFKVYLDRGAVSLMNSDK